MDEPTVLHVYKGMRDGDEVKYVGPVPLEGTFVIDEIVQFTAEDVMVVMHTKGSDSRDVFEVNADNLEKL